MRISVAYRTCGVLASSVQAAARASGAHCPAAPRAAVACHSRRHVGRAAGRGVTGGRRARDAGERAPAPPRGFGTRASMAPGGTNVGQADAEVAPADAEEEEVQFWERIQAHQKAAAKLPPVEEARTIVDRCLRGMLSTLSKKYEGFPFGSMVGFATDDRGRPVLAISSLSPHTRDLAQDPRCSLLVSRNPVEQSETLVTLVGTAQQVPEAEVAGVREVYLKKHPDAFWVDFGDFSFVRIEPITVRFTANIATFAIGASVAELPGDEYTGSSADPIAVFEVQIANRQNREHEEETKAIVRSALGVEVPSARVVGADRFGLRVEAELKGQLSKIRLPFPRPAGGPSEVAELLAEMARAAGA